MGEKILWGKILGGDFHRGNLSERGIFIGVIFIGCNFLGGNFLWGNFLGGNFPDTDKNNIARLEVDNITTTAGYSQVINKPTHFINGTSSCNDLIFSSNMSFKRNYGIEQSIYEKCHHNITYNTLDFSVPLPPPYNREIWDYKTLTLTQKAISNFDWPKAFRNKNANESCKLLTNTFMNIFRNYIPYKTKKFDYKTPE